MNKTDPFHVRSISIHWNMIRLGHPRTSTVAKCEKRVIKNWLGVPRAFTCECEGLRVSRSNMVVLILFRRVIYHPPQRRFRPISEWWFIGQVMACDESRSTEKWIPPRAFASAILQVLSESPAPQKKKIASLAIFKTHSISLKWILSPERKAIQINLFRVLKFRKSYHGRESCFLTG